MSGSAVVSPDGIYRYILRREWDDGPCVCFVMFNPSTADATKDDATIRKCIGFAQRWGYGRMIVVNLYAVRSRDPKVVARTTGAVGPINNFWILQAAKESRKMVFAWGCSAHMPKDKRLREIAALLKDVHTEQVCLGKGKDGSPRHPLMLAYATPLEPFSLEDQP